MADAFRSALPHPAEDWIVVGCGMLAMDCVAVLDSYPKPNEKIRSKTLQFMGGGNAGNALTSASRLGLNARIISKVGDDNHGRDILTEIKNNDIDASHVMISEGGSSMFSYVIVDNQMTTRTCIFQPMCPPLLPDDLPKCNALSAIDGAKVVYLDGEFHEAALIIAKEAARKNIPILVDAERNESGLDDLLNLASFIVCSEDFPAAWASIPSISSALVSILLKLPLAKFVIVTLQEKGCLMLERSIHGKELGKETVDVEGLLDSLKLKVDRSKESPTCISSEESLNIFAKGIGTLCGRLHLGTAEKIPLTELVDTTGAGDAFAGAVLYALCAGMPPQKMLPFACQVAAIKCRALGARKGLPRRTDPRLAVYLH